MLYKRQGFPEESELVMCTVTKVQYDSVFVNLNEYNKQGVIHISEISPGRIRNIRDFVKEGKMVVCKVLRVNQERGHTDLSLRRVTDMQKRQKANEIKQEQKAEKIIDGVAKKINEDVNKLYNGIAPKILKDYDYIFQAFEDMVEENFSILDIGIDKKFAEEITKAVKEKIKPREVEIKGNLNIQIYVGNGIDVIRESLKKNLNDNIEISYAGAGTYGLIVKAKDYKKAESILNGYVDATIKIITEKEGEAKFVRIEN